MLENERSIFKGEYSADKLELYINKQLENEYPVITGLLSNGRRIGAFTTDDGYEIETIDGVEYTKAKFTLSKENGFPLSAGVTQITIWMYRTKDSVLVSKEAIGNVVFTVVDTTSFNDGDIIISGDVEGTVVNLKVEVENLQQVAQINNVAINNLQNNKADKTTLNDYLKRDGSKTMTGDLDMDGNDINNTRLYDNETHNSIALSGLENGDLSLSSKNGALELRSPEMNDLDMANFLTYPTPENTNHTTGEEYETYEWNLPKESGTVVVKEEGRITDITDISNLSGKTGIGFGLINLEEVLIYNPKSTIGLASSEMINEGDLTHSLKFPDTCETTGDGSYNTYTWTLPKKSGTVVLNTDIPTKTSQLINDSGYTTQDDLNDIVAIAQGKTKTYVIEASANSFLGTTSQEALSLSNTLNLTTVDGKKVPFTDLIKGDVILITDTNLPDRFVGSIGEQIVFYPLESRKMDLDDYALKTEIPTKISQLEQDVELGVSEEDVMDIIENNAEQTETLEVEEATEIAIGTSATFNPESDEQIPTSKAVSDLMAGAGGGSKLYRHQITFGQYSSRLNIIIDRADVFDVASLKEYLNTKGYIGDTKGLFADGYPSTLTESNGTKYLMYANKIYINTGNGNINSNGIKVSIIMSDTVPNITTENYTITVSTLTDRVFEL